MGSWFANRRTGVKLLMGFAVCTGFAIVQGAMSLYYQWHVKHLIDALSRGPAANSGKLSDLAKGVEETFGTSWAMTFVLLTLNLILCFFMAW